MMEKLRAYWAVRIARTRPLVNKGWLDSSKQIGQSGKVVQPRFIMNIGISGSPQHTSGMDKAQASLSINRKQED